MLGRHEIHGDRVKYTVCRDSGTAHFYFYSLTNCSFMLRVVLTICLFRE